MINQSVEGALRALADPSRRTIVERLVVAPASVKELARPLSMSLPAVMRHLSVLEVNGLVSSRKVGRVRTCQIEPEAFRRLEGWVVSLRVTWERRLDDLGDYLDNAAVVASE